MSIDSITTAPPTLKIGDDFPADDTYAAAAFYADHGLALVYIGFQEKAPKYSWTDGLDFATFDQRAGRTFGGILGRRIDAPVRPLRLQNSCLCEHSG